MGSSALIQNFAMAFLLLLPLYHGFETLLTFSIIFGDVAFWVQVCYFLTSIFFFGKNWMGAIKSVSPGRNNLIQKDFLFFLFYFSVCWFIVKQWRLLFSDVYSGGGIFDMWDTSSRNDTRFYYLWCLFPDKQGKTMKIVLFKVV